MALTDDQRLDALEAAVTQLQTVTTNLASKKQLQQLSLLKQKEVDDLGDRVTQLETTVKLIQDSL